MHDARTQRPAAVTFTCAYASVSVRARAPRGSSACDHLAECRAELFPLRASLPPLFASLSLFLLSLDVYTLEEELDHRTKFRTIDRKDGISLNDAKVKRSRFDRSSRFQTLSFRLFIAESAAIPVRRLCAVSGEFGASRARIGGLNVEQRISLVFYDSCSTFQPNWATRLSGHRTNKTQRYLFDDRMNESRLLRHVRIHRPQTRRRDKRSTFSGPIILGSLPNCPERIEINPSHAEGNIYFFLLLLRIYAFSITKVSGFSLFPLDR